MRYYKWFLVLAIIIIIALFVYPHVSAKADVFLGSPVTVVPLATSTVQSRITYWSTFYGVDPALAKEIAWCESQYYPKAANPLGSAKGIYQFLDGSWKYYALKHWGEIGDVFNAEDNIELGVWIMAHYGTNDWLASEDCWGTK